MWSASATTIAHSKNATSRLARYGKERVKRGGAVERGGKGKKMQRQKNGERDTGQAMQHGRHKAALFMRSAHHDVNTA